MQVTVTQTMERGNMEGNMKELHRIVDEMAFDIQRMMEHNPKGEIKVKVLLYPLEGKK